MSTAEIKEAKRIFRNNMAQVLKSFCSDKNRFESASIAARAALLKSAFWKDAPVILIYMSTQLEVGTLPLIERAIEQGKRIALPKVRNFERGIMDFYYIDGSTPLQRQLAKGKYGIQEPLPSLPEVLSLPYDSLFVVPGMAFTLDGARLGHGGGYYDRYLSMASIKNSIYNSDRIGNASVIGKNAKTYRAAGLCFPCQIAESLPHDGRDVKMDGIFYA